MRFNKNLAAIHSYLCADGYVIKNPPTQKHKYYSIGLRNTSMILLLDFQQRFFQEFGLKPHICKDGRCRIQSKEIYYFLTQHFSYYSKEWALPNLDFPCLRVWLRAYFDCDAWVTLVSRQNRKIGLDSINGKGLEQIQIALIDFNISSSIKFLDKKNIWRMNIYGKDNLQKFNDFIGFLHPNKALKLKQVLDDYVDHSWKFPSNHFALKEFILSRLHNCTGNRKNVTSIDINNLLILKEHLFDIWRVQSKIYDNKRYFELCINKQESKKLPI